jgi:hypothetical protein
MWPTDLPYIPLNKGWTDLSNFHIFLMLFFSFYFMYPSRVALWIFVLHLDQRLPLLVMISLSRLASFAAVQPPAIRR